MSSSPKSIPEASWVLIEPLIHDIQSGFGSYTENTLLSQRTQLANFVSWALDQGYDLTIESIFTPDNVDRYINNACSHYAESTRRTMAFTLKQVIKKRDLAEVRIQIAPLEKSTRVKSRPYSRTEISQVLDWVDSSTTPYMRETRSLFVACGLGAGLRASEIDTLSWDHVGIDNEYVTLWDIGGRDIPVIDYFADPFKEFLRSNADYVLCPQFQSRRRNVCRRSLGKSEVANARGLKPNSIRMRDTWVEMIVAAGVPISVAVAATGMKNFQRYEHLREGASWESYRFQLHQREPLSKPRLRSV